MTPKNAVILMNVVGMEPQGQIRENYITFIEQADANAIEWVKEQIHDVLFHANKNGMSKGYQDALIDISNMLDAHSNSGGWTGSNPDKPTTAPTHSPQTKPSPDAVKSVASESDDRKEIDMDKTADTSSSLTDDEIIEIQRKEAESAPYYLNKEEYQKLRNFILEGYVKVGDIKVKLYQLDWIQIMKDAYESRKTSWESMGHIREWRNATDEICSAVINHLMKALTDEVGK